MSQSSHHKARRSRRGQVHSSHSPEPRLQQSIQDPPLSPPHIERLFRCQAEFVDKHWARLEKVHSLLIAELQGKVAKLATKINKRDETISRLQQNAAAVEAKHAAVEAKQAAVEARQRDLEAREAALEVRASELDAREAEMQARNDDLRSKEAAGLASPPRRHSRFASIF